MDLNELIEKEGLESVSEKTNISIFNLNKLANEDFLELNRVKALGFLHILKREYEIDTTKLEQSIKSHFEEQNQVCQEPVTTAKKRDKRTAPKGVEKWIFGLILLGAFWYLYSSGKIKEIISGEDSDDINISLLNSDINSSNLDEKQLEKSITIKKENNSTQVEVNTSVALKSGDGLKILANISNENSNSFNEDAGVEEPTPKRPTSDENSTQIKSIVINPTRGLLWYGLIDLDSRKKRNFTTRKSKSFDLNGHKWLMLTGHGFFDIVSDKETISLGDRNKHYFYIDGKEIKELTRKEFRKLNHGRIW